MRNHIRDSRIACPSIRFGNSERYLFRRSQPARSVLTLERCARRERLTHSLPLVSASRLAHLCRSRPRGSIRKQTCAAGAQIRHQIGSTFVAQSLLSVISVLGDSRQHQQDAHRDGKRFVCVRISSKLQLCDSRIADVSRNAVRVWAGFSAVLAAPRGKNFFSLSLRDPTQTNETIL